MNHPFESRRRFLTGAGRAALALPLLPSLLSRRAEAQVSGAKVRYLQVFSPYATNASRFYGALSTNQRPSPHVNTRRLSEVTGTLSQNLGAEFSPLKDKVSVIRGLDCLSVNVNHNYCMATTASSQSPGVDNDRAPPHSRQVSMDVLLSRSGVVYPAAAGVPSGRRLMNLNPVKTDSYSGGNSVSWSPTSQSVEMLNPLKETQALFDAFASGFAGGSVAPAVDAREVSLVQAVFRDYQAVRDSSRISAADQQRLTAYMDMVRDLERDVAALPAPMPMQCAAPTWQPSTVTEQVVDIQFRILAAAMACDLTRVASIVLGMSAGYGERHAMAHDFAKGGANPADFVAYDADLNTYWRRVARLITILDGIADGTGTLLDQSIVYASMQYGCAVTFNQHVADCFPVVVAGRGGGRLSQGWYLDLRKEGTTGEIRAGVPLNNFAVTCFNAMGLRSSDYEASAGAGYGLYPANALTNRPNGADWGTTQGKRSPLPVLYTGPAMG
ncbi:MAG: DUF1552 domain-containing protein [Myxococcaceae bacterium]|nr:DUF1552 domain-containing protein [Myxococcaceae bacterium]